VPGDLTPFIVDASEEFARKTKALQTRYNKSDREPSPFPPSFQRRVEVSIADAPI
jgi:hypothetical protein